MRIWTEPVVQLTIPEQARCAVFLEDRDKVNAEAGTDRGTWQAPDTPEQARERRLFSIFAELIFAKYYGLPMDFEVGVRAGGHDARLERAGRIYTIDIKATLKPAGNLNVTHRKKDGAHRSEIYVLVARLGPGRGALAGWAWAAEVFHSDREQPGLSADKDPWFRIPRAELHEIGDEPLYRRPHK